MVTDVSGTFTLREVKSIFFAQCAMKWLLPGKDMTLGLSSIVS